MIQFVIERQINFNTDSVIITKLERIIKTSYQEFDVLNGYLYRDLKDCNEIYLAKDDNNDIIAFFMVGLIHLEGQDCYYLGLSACMDTFKNNGIGKSLYLEFAKQCKMLEEKIGQRIICYWTTASPIPYYWFCKNYIEVQPDFEGYCKEERKNIIRKIARLKYTTAKVDKDCPFILRSAVSNFKFSKKEKDRLAKAINDLKVNVFSKFSVDETNGDRFLMTGFVP